MNWLKVSIAWPRILMQTYLFDVVLDGDGPFWVYSADFIFLLAISWSEVFMALARYIVQNSDCFLWQENLQDQDPPWLRLKDQ